MTNELPMLRNSERAAFKRCPASWNWGWNEGLQLAMPTTNARWFGTGIHLALAEWYTPPKGTERNAKRGFIRGVDPLETWEKFTKDEFATISCGPYFDEVAEKEYLDAGELGKLMLMGYLAKYGVDDAWEVLMPETRFNLKVAFNKRQMERLDREGKLVGVHIDPNGGFITRLVGTFDMPIRDHTDGHAKVVDHKTSNKRENTAWLTKDDQTGTYISVSTVMLRKLGFIKDSESVVGAIWNYLRKGKPDGRPTDELGRSLNKDGSVSKVQPSPLFWREDLRRNKHNRLAQISRIADDAEVIAKLRSGELPVTKSPGEHCAWCDFKELCAVDEDGGDTEQFKKDVFRVQDMYADHRQGARNSKESVQAKKETGVS